jgi:hypothetical protein
MPLRIAPLRDSLVLEEEMEKSFRNLLAMGAVHSRGQLSFMLEIVPSLCLRHTTAAWTENRICF